MTHAGMGLFFSSSHAVAFPVPIFRVYLNIYISTNHPSNVYQKFIGYGVQTGRRIHHLLSTKERTPSDITLFRHGTKRSQGSDPSHDASELRDGGLHPRYRSGIPHQRASITNPRHCFGPRPLGFGYGRYTAQIDCRHQTRPRTIEIGGILQHGAFSGLLRDPVFRHAVHYRRITRVRIAFAQVTNLSDPYRRRLSGRPRGHFVHLRCIGPGRRLSRRDRCGTGNVRRRRRFDDTSVTIVLEV